MNDHEIYMYQKRIQELEQDLEVYAKAIEITGTYYPERIIGTRIKLDKDIEGFTIGKRIRILVLEEEG